MLLGASRDPKLSLQDQDKDDSQLIEGDVSTGIEDGLPSIRFSERIRRETDGNSTGQEGAGINGISIQRSAGFTVLNQGDNRESNPTVSAKLKGKKVAIYNNSLVEEGSPLKPQLGCASALGRSSREGIKEAGPGNGQAATGFDLAGPSFTAGHRISNLGMIVGPSNVDYGPTVSNGSHGAFIANTTASNSNSSLPKSTDFLDDLPVSPTKNLPSRINVISKQGKSNVFVEKTEVTTLNSDCHSVIKFVDIRNTNNSKGNQPINISSRTQDERNVGSDALKMEILNVQGKTPIFFGVKECACIVREYFVDFEIDVAASLKTKVSGPKANEIISKIGLDCSHRIEARGFTG
ncbi:hypothetical protein Gogos_016996, partial [Gossypium gossypioides]|nr:hypothetical protein [Gossypium gossypioides]